LLNFIARRLVVALFQLVGLVLVVFFAIRLLPADPVARLVGMNASPEAYLSSQRALGLDRPVLEQLGSYVLGVAQGDFGRSWVSGAPVMQDIRNVLPITIELITISFILAFLISVPLGMLCAIKPGGVAAIHHADGRNRGDAGTTAARDYLWSVGGGPGAGAKPSSNPVGGHLPGLSLPQHDDVDPERPSVLSRLVLATVNPGPGRDISHSRMRGDLFRRWKLKWETLAARVELGRQRQVQ